MFVEPKDWAGPIGDRHRSELRSRTSSLERRTSSLDCHRSELRSRTSSLEGRTSSLDSARSGNSNCSSVSSSSSNKCESSKLKTSFSSCAIAPESTYAHAFVDIESGYSSARSTKGGYSWKSVTLLALVLAGGYYHEQEITTALMQKQETAMRELEIDLSTRFDTKVQKLKDDNSRLQGEMSGSDEGELTIRNQQLEDENYQLRTRGYPNLENERQSLKATHEQLTEDRETLQRNIQLMSKTALLEKFGSGPHRLEMHIRFNSDLGRDDSGDIVIEMAPVDELPHSVYWFLEQVSRKLFNGFSFHRNPGHVLSVGPVNNFLSTDLRGRQERFREEGFDSILFQEYSHEFPHNSYTLGYAGQPGGPNFYISIRDNTIIHGPGGQEDVAEAETCFAKVIDGFDIVDRISELPTEGGNLIDIPAIEYIIIRPN